MLQELVTMDCSFFGMSSEYFSAHSQWHYAIISLVSTVSLGSKMSYKMMSTFGKTGMPEDSFRGTRTLKSHPLEIQKSPLVYLWSLFFTNKPHHHITVIKHIWSYITTPLPIPPPTPSPTKKGTFGPIFRAPFGQPKVNSHPVQHTGQSNDVQPRSSLLQYGMIHMTWVSTR